NVTLARQYPRHVWILRCLDKTLQDVTYAVRGKPRAPVITLTAVKTLALAIGANTAIFSVVNARLVRPLPYRDADRLAIFDATREIEGAARPVRQFFSVDAVGSWQATLHTFDSLAYYTGGTLEVSTRNGAEMVDSAAVSPTFFAVLDGPIIAGRSIAPDNALTPSIVVSRRLAERLFGGAAMAVGKQLTLNSLAYTIVGIAGPNWNVPSSTTDIWNPIPFERTINPRCCAVNIVGRMTPAATIAQANADVRDAVQRLAAIDPRNFGRLHTTVTSLRRQQLGEGRQALLLLWAAVGVVLVIACANVLNLFVARNVTRLREFAIRQALGASRGRLLRQGLTESTFLAAGGIAGGVVFAQAAASILSRVDPDTFPQLHDVRIDGTVLAFAVGLGIVTLLATGVMPAIQAARAVAPRTPSGTLTRNHRRTLQILCVAQLGAAVVLLVSASLLGRSLVDLLGTDLGVSPDHVLTASLNAALGRPHTAPELASTLQRIVERVEHLPGVSAAGVSTSLPPNASQLILTLKPDGGDVNYTASAVLCTPGYFHALGMRLVQGRFFTTDDNAQHPLVIIVSVTTARHLFGSTDPIGRTFAIPKYSYLLTASREATVVGVVSDVKYSGIDVAAGDQVYGPFAQAPYLSAFLTVRAANDEELAPAIRRAVASIDPTVAVTSIRPLESILATATAPARFRTVLIAAFALLALCIAATGLYGIVAHSVSRRTAEIGVRMALGAVRRDVMAIVFGEALGMVAAGLALGLPAAYLLARTFAALLFGVPPADAVTYAASVVALLLVALAASYPPARRAARVDPIVALRTD
ncbi:MAG: ABC transporter permease, partial [Vicinamibacterales bacterium]